ncbi:MAG: DUF3499 family protein [Acidimicrobiia bacterium]|nr:DUF3499 family protein [Acidimicrobiia bacterium]MYC58151.1 DUF3499 family protein [Acidimicrobiia bacterium]MYI30583.1 DUF3499 family protein [Acidimicrobiia bacterium]
MLQIYCARTLCSNVASSVLFINARALTAQLVDLDAASIVGGVPLCTIHGNAVVVPQGWELRDMRTPAYEADFKTQSTADIKPEPAKEPEPATKLVRIPILNSETEDFLEDTPTDVSANNTTPMLSRALRAAGFD